VIRELGESYRAVAPDLRGHGAASELRPVTLSAVLSDLRALSPERFVLAGYSMGGRIALHCALAHPARVTRLVLVSASPGLADSADRAARREADEALAASLERDGLEAFAARWAAQPLFAGMAPPAAALAQEDRRRNSAAGLAAALRGLGNGVLAPLWSRLGELAMPVTLVVGERDAKFVGIARAMEPLIPSCRLVVVPGAGHAVHLEAPAAVASALRDRSQGRGTPLSPESLPR
jgi:2-succinyl-6-hydroxy-2,4-cyclohexadiene-1-carboxylate synthase